MGAKVDIFTEELSYIQDEEKREITKDLIRQLPDYFFTIPASSTGKYHPEYALGDGGLYRHTRAAVKIANDILNLEWFNKEFTNDDKDVMIAAIILHDTCKSGKDWDSQYTMHTHPIQAGELVEDTLRDTEYRGIGEEIARLIRSHMGQWNEPGRWNKYNDRTVLPKPEELDEFIVHLCDYLASRKYLEVNGIYDVEE